MSFFYFFTGSGSPTPTCSRSARVQVVLPAAASFNVLPAATFATGKHLYGSKSFVKVLPAVLHRWTSSSSSSWTRSRPRVGHHSRLRDLPQRLRRLRAASSAAASTSAGQISATLCWSRSTSTPRPRPSPLLGASLLSVGSRHLLSFPVAAVLSWTGFFSRVTGDFGLDATDEKFALQPPPYVPVLCRRRSLALPSPSLPKHTLTESSQASIPGNIKIKGLSFYM